MIIAKDTVEYNILSLMQGAISPLKGFSIYLDFSLQHFLDDFYNYCLDKDEDTKAVLRESFIHVVHDTYILIANRNLRVRNAEILLGYLKEIEDVVYQLEEWLSGE